MLLCMYIPYGPGTAADHPLGSKFWCQQKHLVTSVIMPLTSKKLTGHIGFGLSVRQKPCILRFWNFIYGFLMEKYLAHIFSCLSYLPFWSYVPLKKIRMKSVARHILWTVHARVLKFHIWTSIFFLVRVISLSGVMPLWIKSEWNLMHAISYEPYMLGLWNFIYGFLVEK